MIQSPFFDLSMSMRLKKQNIWLSVQTFPVNGQASFGANGTTIEATDALPRILHVNVMVTAIIHLPRL